MEFGFKNKQSCRSFSGALKRLNPGAAVEPTGRRGLFSQPYFCVVEKLVSFQ